MYNSKDGSWPEIEGEWPCEFEATYYLKYNIEKSLILIRNIYKENIDFSEYSNHCVYYHIQIDSLMQSIGHIRDRFCGIDEKRKDINKINYDFNEQTYQLLSDKSTRNFVEHINERNSVLIKENARVGGFNTIREKDDKRTKILTEFPHNNTLDLIEYKYYYYNNKSRKILSIDLRKLEEELKTLEERNKKIWSYITDTPWVKE